MATTTGSLSNSSNQGRVYQSPTNGHSWYAVAHDVMTLTTIYACLNCPVAYSASDFDLITSSSRPLLDAVTQTCYKPTQVSSGLSSGLTSGYQQGLVMAQANQPTFNPTVNQQGAQQLDVDMAEITDNIANDIANMVFDHKITQLAADNLTAQYKALQNIAQNQLAQAQAQQQALNQALSPVSLGQYGTYVQQPYTSGYTQWSTPTYNPNVANVSNVYGYTSTTLSSTSGVQTGQSPSWTPWAQSVRPGYSSQPGAPKKLKLQKRKAGTLIYGIRAYTPKYHCATGRFVLAGSFSGPWNTAGMRAICGHQPDTPARVHLVKDDCTCGIYSYNELALAQGRLGVPLGLSPYDIMVHVVGTVSGATVQSELGYRSEFFDMEEILLMLSPNATPEKTRIGVNTNCLYYKTQAFQASQGSQDGSHTEAIEATLCQEGAHDLWVADRNTKQYPGFKYSLTLPEFQKKLEKTYQIPVKVVSAEEYQENQHNLYIKLKVGRNPEEAQEQAQEQEEAS